jgi:hypothetical protein
MRKMLLASAATVVGMAGSAWAQAPAAPTLPPYQVLGTQSAPSAYLGGNNPQNWDGNTPAPGPTTPTPGTMVIHLNARVWGYVGVEGSSATVARSGPGGGFNKLSPESAWGYFRFYPGVDAMAANGLRYGAIVEIRQNFIGQTYGSSTAGLNGPGGNEGPSPSGNSCGSTLYVRRAAIYAGSNEFGIVRLGQDDGPFSQLDNGITTFQTFGTGGWNGDGPDNIPGNAQPTFPFWSGVGNEYTPTKLVYFSPNLAGFDFGASFAPNNAPNDAATCGVAAAGCAALSSTVSGAFGGENRATNWVEVMGRYRGNFGPLAIYAIAGYSASGHVHVIGSTEGGLHGGTTAAYDGFSVFDGGLAVTYSGFQIGGNVLAGAYNGQVGLKPTGGTNAISWVAGAEYNFGPYGFGVSYYNMQEQGSAAMVHISQRYDDALAVGGSWVIAPGLTATADYLYGQIHQGGVNLLGNGEASTLHNNAHSQSFVVGANVKF